ncbi:hypothetical protein LZ31DRAFT_559903, partial [Colletotrichum somersetense]
MSLSFYATYPSGGLHQERLRLCRHGVKYNNNNNNNDTWQPPQPICPVAAVKATTHHSSHHPSPHQYNSVQQHCHIVHISIDMLVVHHYYFDIQLTSLNAED